MSLKDPHKMATIPVRPMSIGSFAPYGRVLDKPSRLSDIHRQELDYWHALADACPAVRPVWGWLETRHRPFLLSGLERHNHSDEVFIAASGRSAMPFALGGELSDPLAQPDLATLSFFIVEPGQAFIVPKGVWHAPGYPLGDAVHYLILLEALLPSSDIETRAVGPFQFHASLEAL